MFTVPATKGGVCYSFESAPTLSERSRPDDRDYQGHVPSCVGGNALSALTGGIDQWRGFPFNAVTGIARADVTAVTAVFDDGGAENVSIKAGTFVVLYSTSRNLSRLDVQLAGGSARCVGVPLDVGKPIDPEYVPLRLDCDR
ncbi:MAG: hypothetical protein M3450_01780 [Actinomycetota bacterium]|nr:hypothetical protein [Actinomycetota bacterium]